MLTMRPPFTCLTLLLANWPFSAGSSQLQAQHPLEYQDSSHSSSPLISLHKALVEHPSITGSETNVGHFLAEHLKSKNFTVRSQNVDGDRHNVLAYVGDSAKTRVLVTSHIDTVPPYWPYERRGDELWGRGTVDAKGSVAAQIIAVESLIGDGEIGEGDVALLFVVGEETGGPGMRDANDLGLSWEAVIFGEPTELKLARGHKGGLGFNVTARGKAGHSGYPDQGKSAIDMLVQALAALQRIQLPWSEEYGNTTLNIGKIGGGVAANVIPDFAFATVAVRVAAGTPESVLELIKTAVLEASPEVELSFTYGIGPVPVDYDVPGFETAVMSYGTDIPRLKGDHKRYLYGPGSILVAHSDHEHLKIGELEQAVGGYRRLIMDCLRRLVVTTS
ncbi:hypothetical protein B0H66DRAFT_217071 [Apodospora peruviana]|uniref:Peptidase M20 dimerisation domain-containing protein n=1 Tax=Apodospora peruviana TaxID=516989 RepID=A0AAE0M874_9PEZI|nr:hypothetical protein B0H66DRAFT_217071 [Apodospora peruviana]